MLGVPSVNLHQDADVVHLYLNKQKWAEDRTLWNTCQRLKGLTFHYWRTTSRFPIR